MTLVMAAGIGSNFAVMTSDERIAYRIAGHLVPNDKEREVKAYSLTDAVLFGWGGDYYAAHKIKDELSKVVTHGDTLEVCKRHLERITDDINITNEMVVLLSGFYQDGSSGMVMKKTGVPVQELKMKQMEYRYIMIPPTGDYSDRQNELMYIEEFIPDNMLKELNKIGHLEWLQKSINRTVNQLMYVHGVISYKEPELTTPQGFYYLLYKDFEGKLNLLSGSYDTKQIHEKLKEIESEK